MFSFIRVMPETTLKCHLIVEQSYKKLHHVLPLMAVVLLLQIMVIMVTNLILLGYSYAFSTLFTYLLYIICILVSTRSIELTVGL